jgi:hypothetical protein
VKEMKANQRGERREIEKKDRKPNQITIIMREL